MHLHIDYSVTRVTAQSRTFQLGTIGYRPKLHRHKASTTMNFRRLISRLCEAST